MNPLLLVPLALVVGVAYLLARARKGAVVLTLPASGAPPPAPSSAPAPAPAADTPNARLLAAALASLPSSSAVLKPPSPLWDQILGGKLADYLDGLTWGYFATWVGKNADGSKKKGGTTCGIVVAYWAAVAGWPRPWINRKKGDPVAPGDGFAPGLHISKIREGARKDGWLITFAAAPSSGPKAPPATSISGVPVELQPGDLYATEKPGGLIFDGQSVDSTHVGVIKSVGPPDGKGNREVITIDGGQTCQGDAGPVQCAHWNTRVLSPNGLLTLMPKTADGKKGPAGTAARVAWVVRAPERRA